ncbi:hypothetical protein QR680_000858 [Steinernema hermaphroditum]|uniref:Uncharacterized protein n=1 Tax=Steinernema hermaphroditum TaxID=289476 RepID=A0AA39GW94_9BILA|nr:hypothetical protein QR680_000858 [Steinernema hermaphroditum]
MALSQLRRRAGWKTFFARGSLRCGIVSEAVGDLQKREFNKRLCRARRNRGDDLPEDISRALELTDDTTARPPEQMSKQATQEGKQTRLMFTRPRIINS